MASEWINVPETECRINLEIALVIRQLRVEQGYSWNALCERLSELYPQEDYGGGSQRLGFSLCKAAATLLGENVESAPWN